MANQKPVDEIRIGRVKATIWKNGTDEQPRHNVTFSPGFPFWPWYRDSIHPRRPEYHVFSR